MALYSGSTFITIENLATGCVLKLVVLRPPYGYRKVKVKDGDKERPRLEVEPHQARIVASIFNDVIEGKGLKEMVKELNHNGVVGPKGKTWGKTTLHKILTNETYTGTLIWGRTSKRNLSPVRVENAWPAIIDRETFDTVRSKLSGRAPARFNPRRLASRYLFLYRQIFYELPTKYQDIYTHLSK